MEFKKAIFEWLEKSEEVVKELQEKKIALRKKEIKQRGVVWKESFSGKNIKTRII